MKTLKRLIRTIEEIEYNTYNYGLFLSIDRHGAIGDIGINPFLKINPLTKKVEPEDELTGLKIQIFSSYMLEMYFAYAKGKNTLYLDTEYWDKKQATVERDTRINFSKIYNLFNGMYIKRESKISTMVDIMLPIIFEQMELQTTYVSSYVRFFKIYADNEEVNTIFEERKGLSLKKFVALSWVIFGYTQKNDKLVISKEDFETFASSTSITKEEINIFLKLISSTRDKFKELYFQFRKRSDGSWFDYEVRESFEKGLPKISYFYPFIDNEDYTYSLISFTAYKQFMKLRGLYRTMTEEFTDIEFKSSYAGPLFEDYVRDLVEKYEALTSHGGLIGGNETYFPTKKIKYDEPDVIYDTNDFLLFIECKSTPFALNLLQEREPESLTRMKDDIEKSIENIDRYMNYRHPKGVKKRVVKILVYYDVPHLTLDILMSEIRKYVTAPDFYIMDIETLELLLMENLGHIPKVMDDYRKDHAETHRDMNSYLRGHVDMRAYDIESDRILHELVEKEMELPVPENRLKSIKVEYE